jgi:glycosyltransferase involved in cell wall biosynthesis
MSVDLDPPSGRGRDPLYINGRFLSQETTGVQRFAQEIVRVWDAMIGSGEIDERRFPIKLLTPPNAYQTLPLSHIEISCVGTNRGWAWDQIDLPRFAGDGVLFSPCSVGPAFKRKHFVAIHDAIFLDMPENYTAAFRRGYRLLIPILCRNASRIVTVSEYSKSRLVAQLPLDASRVLVTGSSGEHMLRFPADANALTRLGLRPERFILAVGSLKPVKNFQAVVQAWRQLQDLDLDLVVVGNANPRIFGAATLEQTHRVHLVGGAEDGVLRALYENALCLAFPSVMEGFGLPVAEAMSLGCPVVAARTGAIPEVGGDAILYCHPLKPQELADHIRMLFHDSSLRHHFRTLGLERGATFKWSDVARAIYGAMTSVISTTS